MPKALPRRRLSRRLPCNGQCGKKGCTYIAAFKSHLKQHQCRERKHSCPVCKKIYSCKYYCKRHVRTKHPDEAIAYLPRTKLKCPVEFEGTKMTAARWQFLKKMVLSNVRDDRRIKNLRPQDCILLSKMNNNTTIHHMAAQIARRILNDGLLEENATDAFGGFLPNGIIMRHHGGLFKLSIDRLVNKHSDGYYSIHYHDPNNAMANIRLVPLALNTGNCGTFTLGMVQEAVGQPVDLPSLLEYESRTYRNSNDTTLYACCNSILCRDELALSLFGNRRTMWQWARARLESIGGRCEISGIPLRTNQQKGSPFQMSIDAIQPILGHMPGNMRIVCRFLNNVCCDKLKTHKDPEDGPSQWTPELFRQYFRIGKS